MSIKSFLFAVLATLSVASPILDTRNGNHSTGAGGINTVTILPTVTSLWNSGSSTVTYGTSYGLAQRYTPSLNEFSTLLSFNIPSYYSSNTCQLIFTLTQAGSYAAGTEGSQVFFDQKAASPGAQSDFRDTQIANFKAVNGGYASWYYTDGRPTGSTAWTVPCSDLIQKPWLEVAPQGQSDYIYWTLGDGLKVQVLGA